MFHPLIKAFLCSLIVLLPCQLLGRNVDITKKLERRTIGLVSLNEPASILEKVEQTGLIENEKFLLAVEMAKLCFPELAGSELDFFTLADLADSIKSVHLVIHRAEKESLKGSLAINLGYSSTGESIEPSIRQYLARLVSLCSPSGKNAETAAYVIRIEGDWIVVSNSESDAAALISNLNGESLGKKSLFQSRRFQSVLARLDAAKGDVDLFAYINPALWKSYAVHQKLAREREWEAKAFDEVASIGLIARLPSQTEPRKAQLFAAASISFTVPRTGIGSVVDSYLPIEEFPPLAKSPSHVTAVRKDNRSLMQKNREIFDAMYGKGTFDRLRESFLFDWKSGAVEGFSETEFHCWYDDQDYFTKYLGYLALDLNTESDDQLKQNISRYFESQTRQFRPDLSVQEVSAGGYPGWFFSEDDAQQLFLTQRPYLKADALPDDFQFPNSGAVLWGQWLVFCEKQFANSLDQRSEFDSEPKGSFGEMVNCLKLELPDTPPPFYIESRWEKSWRDQLKFWQAGLIHYLFPDSGEVLQRFVYEADKNLMSVETEDPKEAFINLVSLTGGAIIDQMGQSTLTLSKTDEGNVTLMFGLFANK